MNKKFKKIISGVLIVATTTTVGFSYGKTHAEKPFGEFNGEEIQYAEEIEWVANNTKFKPVACDLSVNDQMFIYYLSEAYNLDFSFVMAIIKTESGFKADTISPTNDYGLMQINKCNHGWISEQLGIIDFLDPKENVQAGMYILKSLSEKYGDPKEVLMCYNMGESAGVNIWNEGIHDTDYTNKVLNNQKEIKKEIENEE